MNLKAVMEEIADKLKMFTGLNVFDHPVGSVTPPAAIVSYPDEIHYDETYQRGEDIFVNLPVFMVTGRTDTKSARDQASEWTDPSSVNSVKTFLDRETYSSCGSVWVVNAAFDVTSIAGIDYLMVVFSLNVTGEGE